MQVLVIAVPFVLAALYGLYLLIAGIYKEADGG